MTAGDKIKLRAELAGKAMQGIRSNADTMRVMANRNDLEGEMIDLVAQLAVQQADALMAELGIKGDGDGYDDADGLRD